MYVYTHIHTYTGLDPASRRLLWRAIKRARASRAVFLTTHSMEEAENLCDRLGIFVDGELLPRDELDRDELMTVLRGPGILHVREDVLEKE